MSYKSNNPLPGLPVIFSTQDVFGNQITFFAQTWIQHILPDHPEMAIYQHLIRPCIVEPSCVRASTYSPMAVVFENTVDALPPEDKLRVIVKYGNSLFLDGGSTGVVTTAFPVNSKKYPNPQIGRVLHKKKK